MVMMQNPVYRALVEYSPGLFTDISSAVTGYSVNRAIGDPVDQLQSGRTTLVCLNEDGKFNDSYTENVFKYSNDFSLWDYKVNSLSPSYNALVAPDGTQTMDILADTSVNSYSSTFMYTGTGTILGGQPYTASAFIAKDSTPASSRFPLFLFGLVTNSLTVIGNQEFTFDTQTGSYFANGSLVSKGFALDCGSCWRIGMECLSPSSADGNSYIQVFPARGIGNVSSTGNITPTAVGTIGMWGVQVNRGGLKNYTTTSGTAVTAPYIPIGKRVNIQAQNRNELFYSEYLTSNPAQGWTVNAGSLTLVSSMLGPSGKYNVSKYIEDTGNVGKYINQTLDITSRGILGLVTDSIRAKAGERSLLIAQHVKRDATYGIATFNLANGSVTGLSNVSSAFTINEGGGWYRCVVSYDVSTGNQQGQHLWYMNLYGAYTGDGASGLYVTEAQHETGPLSDYIANTSSRYQLYPIFNGFIQEIDRDAQYGNRVATFNCYDQTQKLSRANITSPIYTNYPVSSLTAAICALAGVGSYTAIDPILDVIPYFWANNESASGSLQKIMDYGHYYGFTDGSGRFNLLDRNSYVTAVPVGSYNEWWEFSTIHDEDKIYNDVAITGNARQLYSQVSTVGWISTPISIAGSATVQFFINYVDPLVPTEAAPAINMVIPVSSADLQLNATSDNSGSVLTGTATASVTFFGASALCAVTNGTATAGFITKFQVYGNSIRAMPTIRQTSVNSASQNLYGDKQWQLDSDLIYDANYTQSYADFMVGKYKDAFPRIKAAPPKNLFPDILNIDVGDLISAVNSTLNVSSAYLVREVTHTINTEKGRDHLLELTLEVVRTGQYLVLDDAVLGILDDGRVLGF